MITDEQAKIAIEAYWSNETDELPAMRKALEAYEASKSSNAIADHTLDAIHKEFVLGVLKKGFYAGFMASGEGYNGEWGGIVACDREWKSYLENETNDRNGD